VMHAHVHVIPRRHGDVDDPKGGVRWVVPNKAAYWAGGRSPAIRGSIYEPPPVTER
jgi:diadenosine tetraphosphate (Ap4A) HIT family hydrolase